MYKPRLNFQTRSNAAMHVAVFQSRTYVPMTIAEIARAVGVSKRYAHKLLQPWLTAGLLTKVEARMRRGGRVNVHYWISTVQYDRYVRAGYSDVCFDAYKTVGNFNIALKRREFERMI